MAPDSSYPLYLVSGNLQAINTSCSQTVVLECKHSVADEAANKMSRQKGQRFLSFLSECKEYKEG